MQPIARRLVGDSLVRRRVRDAAGHRWRALATPAAFIEKWTDPNDAVWQLPIQTPCAQVSAAPDRIIFSTVNWHYVTEAEWETAINEAVQTLKGKSAAFASEP